MRLMTEQETRILLTERPRTGKLATTRADGRPHVAPVWFDLDGDGTVVFTTGATSLKGKAIRRDPRVCLCVELRVRLTPIHVVAQAGTAD